MKKYLRLILEILLGICLVATAALAYWNFSAKKHLNEQVAELSEQLDEAKEWRRWQCSRACLQSRIQAVVRSQQP
jgi:cell division protein FtsL